MMNKKKFLWIVLVGWPVAGAVTFVAATMGLADFLLGAATIAVCVFVAYSIVKGLSLMGR